MSYQPNVRLRNKFNELGGQWEIKPADPQFAKRVAIAKADLALFRKEEPTSGWMLESFGQSNGWHTFQD